MYYLLYVLMVLVGLRGQNDPLARYRDALRFLPPNMAALFGPAIGARNSRQEELRVHSPSSLGSTKTNKNIYSLHATNTTVLLLKGKPKLTADHIQDTFQRVTGYTTALTLGKSHRNRVRGSGRPSHCAVPHTTRQLQLYTETQTLGALETH